MRTAKKTPRVGFTLIEVLVAASVSLLLGLTVFNIFYQSRRSIAGASDRIQLIQATRAPLSRISGYIQSGSNVGSTDPVLFPPINGSKLAVNEFGNQMFDDDPSSWAKIICFSTAEDFFDPNFDPEGIMDITAIETNLDAYVTDSHRIHQYVIWWESTANGHDFLPDLDDKLCLARLVDDPIANSRGPDWGRNTFAADPASFIDPNFDPRVLAHQLTEASFYRLSSNTLEVSVLVDGEVTTTRDDADKQYRATVTVQLPTITDD